VMEKLMMGKESKGNYMATALLTGIFTLPSGTYTPLYVLVYLLLLLSFTVLVYWQTRKASHNSLLDLKNQHPAVFYLLLLFAVSSFISWLSMLFSNDASYAQKVLGSYRYAIYWLVAFYSFMLLRLCVIYELSHETLYKALVLGVCFLTLLFLASYMFHDAPNAARWNTEPPFTGNIRIAGMLAAVGVVISIVAVCLSDYCSRKVALFYIALFICSTFLVWTGSRMSLIACWLTIFLLLTFGRAWGHTTWKNVIAIVALLALSLPVAESLSLSWGGVHRVVGITQKSLVAENTLDTFSNNRLDVWKSALNAVADKPLFGHAPFGYFFVDDGVARANGHTHNLFLELLVEWGVIGAGLFTLFLLTLAVIGMKQLKYRFLQEDTAWLMSASIVFLLSIIAMADGTYFVLTTVFILATAFVSFPLLETKRK